jgi:hypothetical protein
MNAVRCPLPGCENPVGKGKTGACCGAHAVKISADARAKMSAAKRGRTLSAEHRAAIAEGHRGAAEERWCEYCGESLGVLPVGSSRRFCNRSHAKASQWANERDKLIEAQRGPGEERSCKHCGRSLGWVPARQLERGRGQFCGHSCRMRSQWEQAVSGLRRERSGREVTCPGCGTAKGYRRPSRISTEYCASCSRHAQEASLALLRDKARQRFALLTNGDALTRQDVARRLQRSPGHLTRWIRAGVLKTREEYVPGMGRVHLFDRVSVERLEQRRLARKLPRRVKRITDLIPRRRGRPPSAGPSPIDVARNAEIQRARVEMQAAGRSVSDRAVRLRAARTMAARQPWLLPADYVEDGHLRPHHDYAANALLAKAERACKIP